MQMNCLDLDARAHKSGVHYFTQNVNKIQSLTEDNDLMRFFSTVSIDWPNAEIFIHQTQ